MTALRDLISLTILLILVAIAGLALVEGSAEAQSAADLLRQSIEALRAARSEQNEPVIGSGALRPFGAAFGDDGTLYVTSRSGVHVFSKDGQHQKSFSSVLSGTSLNVPQAVDYDDGEVFVADTNNHRVVVFDEEGNLLRVIGGPEELHRPMGVAAAGMHLVVVDSDNHRVLLFERAGQRLASLGGLGQGEGEFSQPRGVAIDRAGTVYVADTRNARLQVLEIRNDELVWVRAIPLSERPRDVEVLESGDLLVLGESALLLVSGEGEVIARYTGSAYGGVNNPIAVAASPGGLVALTDADGVLFTTSQLVDPVVTVDLVDPETALLTWRELAPGRAVVRYGQDPAALDRSVTVESDDSGVQRAVLSELLPNTRYAFQVESTVGAIPPRPRAVGRFLSAPPQGTTQYITAPTLAAVFRNGKMTDEDIEILKEQLERVRLFYWVNSYLTWNIEWDVLVIDEPFGEPSGFIGPDRTAMAIEQGLAAQGKRLDEYTGVVVYIPVGAWQGDRSRIVYRTQALGGAAFGVPAPWPNGALSWVTGYAQINVPYASDVTWVTLHEYHHQLDALHAASGFPDYAHADWPIRHPGPYGEHYDFNAWIARGLPRRAWLLNNYGRLTLAEDADGDLVPDDDPRVPLDERRFGSSSAAASTNGSISDFELILTSIWVGDGLGLNETAGTHLPRPNPERADQDGDGILDADDPYPLYAADPDRPMGTPVIDGVIEAGEWHRFMEMADQDLRAVTYVDWDEEHFYFAVEMDRFAVVRLRLITGENGWFQGTNYEIQVRPAGMDGRPAVSGYIYDNRDVDEPYRQDVALFQQQGITARYSQQEGGAYHIELSVPRQEGLGLRLEPGDSLGLHVTFNFSGSRPWVSLFEPHSLYYLRLVK